MELCEAINHAREVAMQFNVCSGCRKEHNQLADWLEELANLKDILGDTYDLDRLRELVKANRDGRCVVYQPGYPVVKTYNKKDGDGLYTMEACGVVSENEYKNSLKEVERDGTVCDS